MKHSFTVKKALLCLAGGLLVAGLFIPNATESHAASADDFQLEYQVKFLLDSNKVLDDDNELKEAYQEILGTDDDFDRAKVAYLETKSRDFNHQGWLNRIRKKENKKNIEMAYKKRYTISDTDIKATGEEAIKDGFDPEDKDLSVSVDWGYSKMTLTMEYEAKVEKTGEGNSNIPGLTKSISYAKENMPKIENHWKGKKDWGKKTVSMAQYAGPVSYKRYKGDYKGMELAVEVWPVENQSTKKVTFITEASFKTEDYDEAKKLRKQLTKALDNEKILLHEDALKTGTVLDAYIGK